MDAIRTQNDTNCELEMAKIRLSLLLDKKEELYAKYFPLTQKLKDDVIKGGKKDNDKMAQYVHELNEVDYGTGRSLAQEIEYQRAVISKLKYYVELMNDTLKKYNGIERDLYYEIVINGVNTSRAVSKIAERYGKEEQTIWKYHYRKIKENVKKLKKYSESTVNILV